VSLEELERRPARTLAVTMECAGNGRALFAPRRVSQPWLHEAIGTAEWTGTPLRGLLEEVGLAGEPLEIVFTGRDRGIEGGEIQHYQRSLPVEEAMGEEMLLTWAMNGRPLEPQHGYPLRLVVPGWYGMASVKCLDRIEAVAAPFDGYQMTRAYRYQSSPDGPHNASRSSSPRRGMHIKGAPSCGNARSPARRPRRHRSTGPMPSVTAVGDRVRPERRCDCYWRRKRWT
jgi:DMSO/TMAO reductase YedYZ molybdopterin-dependent catalytic subunit